ncbi:uncharacterized protein LOC106771664 [Vigna radiata var. radiata]|uniref:Uncharacterized protein LOC106771664 n=1 Tax=Vigna radiata var. radiata TaxID=3916 RepID=A0A1S3V467_VIGRR|nr:uncharacterized protein LOC106771664 [Vigna radiata var. radiata]
MPRKASPFFHKVSLHLLRLSLLIHRLRKPILPKLLKRFKNCQKLKLLKHSDYGEYRFSASTTPLIIPRHHRNQFKNRVQPALCSFLYLYWCLGNFKVERNGECQLALEPFEIGEETSLAQDLFEYGSGDEGESVDQKAEKFIQSFYQQMRMQRQESL